MSYFRYDNRTFAAWLSGAPYFRYAARDKISTGSVLDANGGGIKYEQLFIHYYYYYCMVECVKQRRQMHRLSNWWNIPFNSSYVMFTGYVRGACQQFVYDVQSAAVEVPQLACSAQCIPSTVDRYSKSMHKYNMVGWCCMAVVVRCEGRVLATVKSLGLSVVVMLFVREFFRRFFALCHFSFYYRAFWVGVCIRRLPCTFPGT